MQANDIRSVIEFGCGDGNQLSLADYPAYIGLDVSQSAIKICKSRYSGDATKSFFIYDGACYVDNGKYLSAELAISLDVLYHLIEDDVYHSYMDHLFSAGQRFIVVYSTNDEIDDGAAHVRHRRFSDWVESNRADWQLARKVDGPGMGSRRADFFVYGRGDNNAV